ncbi:MAG: hypothetical protein K2Q45_06775 [Nitrosomonas sp.]|nr:hypothetical protein [Nitrosomonas sp.]
MKLSPEDFKRHPFWNASVSIHRERCDADLMYRVLESSSSQDTVVKEILFHCFALIEKKNTPDLMKSRMYTEGKEFILSDDADHMIRVFCLCFFLSKEVEVQELFMQALQINHPGNMFKESAIEHMQSYFKTLKNMTEMTFNFHCNRVNIPRVARDLVFAARENYKLN